MPVTSAQLRLIVVAPTDALPLPDWSNKISYRVPFVRPAVDQPANSWTKGASDVIVAQSILLRFTERPGHPTVVDTEVSIMLLKFSNCIMDEADIWIALMLNR